MIISRLAVLPLSQTEGFGWARLRRFQNTSYVVSLIMSLHKLPEKYRSNAKKQAEQIRFCLIQASEYFAAARVVSLATKPLLLYYGIMSLALAEILLKQSGESSLDVARAHHAHHGLLLKSSGDPSKVADLQTSAAMLRAAPMINAGNRQGTFELWHSSSRESPICGWENVLLLDAQQRRIALLGLPVDIRFPLLPVQGVSLLDCFASLPGMMQILAEYGISSNLARGVMSSERNTLTGIYKNTVVIHPTDK